MQSNNVTMLEQMEMDELDELFEMLGIENNGADFLTGEVPEEVENRFRIDDVEKLSWTFRKIEAVTAKLNSAKALRDVEIARINEWYNKEAGGLEEKIEFFSRLIREYAERGRLADSKWKGEKTPYGTLSFTKSQPDWTYTNEAETLEFLKADEKLAGHVKVMEAIANKTEIKKVLEVKRNVFVKDGQVVDVAEATPGGWVGMQYAEYWKELTPKEWEDAAKDAPEHATVTGDAENGGYLTGIVDISTGEFVEGVELADAVAVYAGKVVPGLTIVDKPDRINIKGAK